MDIPYHQSRFPGTDRLDFCEGFLTRPRPRLGRAPAKVPLGLGAVVAAVHGLEGDDREGNGRQGQHKPQHRRIERGQHVMARRVQNQVRPIGPVVGNE